MGRLLPLSGLIGLSAHTPYLVAMCPDAPYFIILLCLMPHDFTCEGESAATQWVKTLIALFHHFINLSCPLQ
jgi:hypothetical protein